MCTNSADHVIIGTFHSVVLCSCNNIQVVP